jgi:hypothetical protein
MHKKYLMTLCDDLKTNDNVIHFRYIGEVDTPSSRVYHRSLETRINLSPQPKIDHFKQVDPFFFFTKMMFSIWVDTVQKVYPSL